MNRVKLKNFLLATMCYSFKRILGSNQLTAVLRGVACFVVFKVFSSNFAYKWNKRLLWNH